MLTNHPEGSVRQLWTLAFPLMISSLSAMSMIFVDRLMLARYCIEAHNAAVSATTLGWAFIYGWMTLASITEVFVAQRNGANQDEQIGRPVWQMIWLSFASVLFFVPLSFWGGSLFYQEEQQMQCTYFSWMMLFAPGYPLFAALAGFFIGRGKPNLITAVAILANIFNIALDYLLIFGWEGWIPPMGVKGAAIATNSALILEIAILAAYFLSAHSRRTFGTNCWKINFSLLTLCLRVGFPGGLFAAMEIFGWAIFYSMMEKMGPHYMTVAGITQSIVILLYFFSEGLSKAVATVVGNVIGAGRPEMIGAIVRSSYILTTIFCLIAAFSFLLLGKPLLAFFLQSSFSEEYEALLSSLYITLFLGLIYTFFDAIRLALAGALTAAADTWFLLIVGSFSVWIFLILPVYYFILIGGATIEIAMLFTVFYAFGAAFLYWRRLRSGAWEKKCQLT